MKRIDPRRLVFIDESGANLAMGRSHAFRAHKAPAVADLIARRGAIVKFLPPYSHDFNPIEAVWGLVKKHIRAFAPRTAATLRQVARAARHAVDSYHCHQFFAKAGYVTSSA